MKKKVLVVLLAVIMCLTLTGCGSNKVERSNNKVECTNDSTLSIQEKIIVYYDDNDKVQSFDHYETSFDDTLDEEVVKKLENNNCNNDGIYKKEWIEECSYEYKDNILTIHYYMNNGEKFGILNSKELFLKNLEGTELSGYTCVEK